MITREITVWCDHETNGITCPEWRQYNESEARGQPSRARQCAKQAGWTHTRDGKDLCPHHSPVRSRTRWLIKRTAESAVTLQDISRRARENGVSDGTFGYTVTWR